MASILIVEDDVDIARGIAEYLEAKGYQLDFAYNGKQAIEHIENETYELILLDLNLPVLDGLSVCRSLMTNKLARIPVIIMLARGETDDILSGFQSGAWDYLVKPFSFAELNARIEVGLAKTQQTEAETKHYQDIILDKNTLSMTYKNRHLQLHQVGFDVIWLLVCHAPNVVKTQLIQQKLWGERRPDSDPLRAHIYKLRKQLSTKFQHDFIEMVKGVGYRINVQK